VSTQVSLQQVSPALQQTPLQHIWVVGQHASPPGQAGQSVGQAQLPLWQVFPPVHMLPHVPQLLLSFSVPLGQTQLPLWQVWPWAQTVPQVPQLLLSPRVPLAQTHWPLVQMVPFMHTVPQVPQLWLSALVVGQEPLQQVWPELQQAARLVPVQQLCPLEQQTTAPPLAMQAALPALSQLSHAFTQATKSAFLAGFVGKLVAA
jgi:hypothetical protein